MGVCVCQTSMENTRFSNKKIVEKQIWNTRKRGIFEFLRSCEEHAVFAVTWKEIIKSKHFPVIRSIFVWSARNNRMCEIS